MNRNTIVHMKNKYNVTDLSGEKVMVDFNSGKYFLIKGVGNDIWDMIQQEITIGDIINRLMSEYEVSMEECEESVFEFLDKLKNAGMIEV